MSQPTVTETVCVMHERGEKCGTVWYSFTAHNHTVGACAPKGRKFKARIDEDKKTGQVTLVLEDQQSKPVVALAIHPA